MSRRGEKEKGRERRVAQTLIDLFFSASTKKKGRRGWRLRVAPSPLRTNEGERVQILADVVQFVSVLYTPREGKGGKKKGLARAISFCDRNLGRRDLVSSRKKEGSAPTLKILNHTLCVVEKKEEERQGPQP